MKKTLIELSEELDAYFKPPDAHLDSIELNQGFSTLLIAILVLAAECWGIFCVVKLGTPFDVAIVGHAALIAILSLYTAILYKKRCDCRFDILLCLSVLFAGPFGAMGMIIALITHLVGTKNHRSFDEFFEKLAPTHFKRQSEIIYENILSGRDDAVDSHSIIPFLDVISFGSETQKRQALAKMTKNYQSEFAPVFRRALSDNNNMIRVQAATAIARIESQFLRRLNKLSINKSLENANPEMLLAVAEHYDNYAFTGLLDKDNERMNRNKALELYQRYMALKPKDHEVFIKIGRAMMRNREYEKASHWFHRYIESHPQRERIAPSVSDWYSECLFSIGQYEELRRYRSSLPGVSTRDDIHLVSLKEALSLWEGTHYAAS